MNNPDVILIGAGKMSAILAIFLKDLQLDITIRFMNDWTNQLQKAQRFGTMQEMEIPFYKLNYTLKKNLIKILHLLVKT